MAEDMELADGSLRWGAWAAFVMAASPIFIALPLIAAVAVGAERSFGGGDLDTEVAAIVANPVLYGSTGLIFLALGAGLVVLALALHDALRRAAPFAIRVGAAAGVIGGALIVLGGFGPAALGAELGRVEEQDPQAAVAVYVANTMFTARLSATGMVMFGAFALVVSMAGRRVGLLSRSLTYLGVVLGAVLLLSNLLPDPFWIISIPLMVIWSAWLGVVLLRRERRSAVSAT